MKTRSACHCLLCQLEIHLNRELCEPNREQEYAEIAGYGSLLSAYPTPFALSTHLRSCRSNGNATHPADAILSEMLHLRQRNQTDTLLRDVLLLAFIPVLHATSRQLGRRYPLLSSDDTVQHLVASLLETFDAPDLLRRDSHLAFAISRKTRRNIFEWAEHEVRVPGNAGRDEPVAQSEGVPGIPEPLERMVLLRHFLCRCQREGLLGGTDLDLLVHIKLEGNFGDGNGTSEYSNALRQRIKRLLAKLRKAARSSVTAPHGDTPDDA
jgi:hypothetical protein